MRKKRIMFLCTGNSCRSQMAEGFARALGGDKVEAFSAGLEPAGLNPRAVQVMAEAGVDISGHLSKPIDPALLAGMGLIVTLCGDAEERCPLTPPNIKRLHWPLPDPARATGSEEEVQDSFRMVRDAIRQLVTEIIGEL